MSFGWFVFSTETVKTGEKNLLYISDLYLSDFGMNFKCDQCDLKYANKLNLNRHNAAKHQMIRYSCTQCNAEYTLRGSLHIHIRDKHKGEKLKCNTCDFQTGVTNGNQNMAAHRRLKHGEQSLKCGMCEFETHSASTLWDHKKRVHDGYEKRLNCNKCDFSSHNRYLLNQHITQMHNTGQDLVKCDKCVYQTTTTYNLKRHTKQKHEEHQMCELCPYSGCKSSVAGHMKWKHGEFMKCSLCDFQSKVRTQIRLHNEKKHQNIKYECNECNANLSSLIGLKQHKDNKHRGLRYKCSKCDYKATLKGNLKIHTQAMHDGIKYPCGGCSYTASTPRSLSLHKKACSKVWKSIWLLHFIQRKITHNTVIPSCNPFSGKVFVLRTFSHLLSNHPPSPFQLHSIRATYRWQILHILNTFVLFHHLQLCCLVRDRGMVSAALGLLVALILGFCGVWLLNL